MAMYGLFRQTHPITITEQSIIADIRLRRAELLSGVRAAIGDGRLNDPTNIILERKNATYEINQSIAQDGMNLIGTTGEIIAWGKMTRVTSQHFSKVVRDKFGCTVIQSRAFVSSDQYVAETATKLDELFPGRVIGVNQSMPANVAGETREVDILMDQFVLQVKGGKASGLARQVKETQSTLLDQRKRVIGYAPGNYSGHAWTRAANEGVPIARNFDELVAIIKELSRP